MNTNGYQQVVIYIYNLDVHIHTGGSIQIFVPEQVGQNPLFTCSWTVHEQVQKDPSFFLLDYHSWTRGTVHELSMNMFKFQDGIWTELEQVEFEQVHEQVMNNFNLNNVSLMD